MIGTIFNLPELTWHANTAHRTPSALASWFLPVCVLDLGNSLFIDPYLEQGLGALCFRRNCQFGRGDCEPWEN